jgi:hypothetical protein
MSAPEDRLIGDEELERLQRDAEDVFTKHSEPVARQLALGALALIRDRTARQELTAIRGRESAG